MPWNGKRKLKPLFRAERCLCAECGGACPDPVAPGNLIRCEPCHYGERHPMNTAGDLRWYCTAAGHPDSRCSGWDEHRAKLAVETAAIKSMLKMLDHSIEVGKDRQEAGQLTFEECA